MFFRDSMAGENTNHVYRKATLESNEKLPFKLRYKLIKGMSIHELGWYRDLSRS